MGFPVKPQFEAVWTGARNEIERNGGGTIINISSQAANRFLAEQWSYAVAKSGVNNLTQTLAVEMAPLGIRVNSLWTNTYRGFLEFTGMTEADIPDMGRKFGIPLGRIGRSEDIAPACIYRVRSLCS